MNFNHYVIIKTEKELRQLFIIINAYQTIYGLNITNLSKTNEFISKLKNYEYIAVCIEKDRITFSQPNYLDYINNKKLKQIDIKEILKNW